MINTPNPNTPGRILHVLSQYPDATGSGTTVQAEIGLAAEAGWEQHLLTACNTDQSVPAIQGLEPERMTLLSTDLPGVRSEIAPVAGALLTMVPLPRLISVDQPDPDDLPGFVLNLARGIRAALNHDISRDHAVAARQRVRERFGWSRVFNRLETVWREVLR